MELISTLVGGRKPSLAELQAQQSIGAIAGLGALPPLRLGLGVGCIGNLAGQRLQTTSGLVWALLQAPAADTGPVLQQFCQAWQEAVEQDLGRKFLHIAFGRVPVALFDGPSRAIIAFSLGAAPTMYLGVGALNGPVNKRATAGQAHLTYAVLGSQGRFGGMPRGAGTADSAERALYRAVVEGSSWYVSSREVVPAAQTPLPLPDNQKKRRMTASDDIVIECKRRLGAGGLTWEADSQEMVKYVQTAHPAYYYYKSGQNLVKQLQKEWEEDHPESRLCCTSS